MKVEIVDAKRWHVGAIMHRLRHEHALALDRVGEDAHREFRTVFDDSAFKKALLIDGRLAAVGGVHGTLAESTGYAWIAISQGATKYPLTLVREVRRQLELLGAMKQELATTIIGGDEAAKRFAIFLGFHVEHGGMGEPAFSKPGRKRLSEHLDTTPDIRIPWKKGYVIPMGFHH